LPTQNVGGSPPLGHFRPGEKLVFAGLFLEPTGTRTPDPSLQGIRSPATGVTREHGKAPCAGDSEHVARPPCTDVSIAWIASMLERAAPSACSTPEAAPSVPSSNRQAAARQRLASMSDSTICCQSSLSISRARSLVGRGVDRGPARRLEHARAQNSKPSDAGAHLEQRATRCLCVLAAKPRSKAPNRQRTGHGPLVRPQTGCGSGQPASAATFRCGTSGDGLGSGSATGALGGRDP
jgi:hypothetical protein